MTQKSTTVVATYYRLSRESEGSASIETQRRAVRTWLDANGFKDAEVVEYIDSGVSGAKPLEAREQMRRLMQSRPDVIVAWKLDRYARSVSEFLRLIAWAESRGVRLATTDNTINTTTATHRMVAVVLAALAEWEREMIRSRILDSHSTRRAQGRWGSGQPPYGYQIERREDGAYLVIDEEQATRIRAAVKVLIDPNGEGTVAGTARMVDISEPQWRRLLKNVTLRGYRMHKGKLEVGADGVTPTKFAEPIISAAEHKAIKERLAALATGKDRAQRGASPMCAGMTWCYRCDGPMNGGTSDKGVRLYRCKKGHVTIYAEALDTRVSDDFLTRWGSFAEYTVRLEGGNDLSDAMAEAQEQAARIAASIATAGPLMMTMLTEKAAELEAAYAALRAAHDPEVREVLEPTGRTLGEAWEAETDRPRLLRDMGLQVTVSAGTRGKPTDRVRIEWATGGDDQELIEYLEGVS